MKNRKLLLIVSLVLALTMSLGGTLAYLTDTDADVNVMVVGNVQIVQNEQQRVDQTVINSALEPFDTEEAQAMLPIVGNDGAKHAQEINGYALEMRNGNEVKNYIDKIVSVTNTGASDAYVRTIFAFPEAGDFDTTYNSADQWFHWNPVSDTDTTPGNGWMWGRDKSEWPGNTDNWDVLENVIIGGQRYDVYVATNKNVIAPKETTAPSLLGIYLYKTVDCDVDENGNLNYTYKDGTGKTWNLGDITNLEVRVLSQAVQASGFEDAWTALDTAFGEVDHANVQAWMTDIEAGSPGDKNDTNNPPVFGVAVTPGNIDSIDFNAAGKTFELAGNFENVAISELGEGSVLKLNNASIGTLTLSDDAAITGNGSIEKITVQRNGENPIELKIDNADLDVAGEIGVRNTDGKSILNITDSEIKAATIFVGEHTNNHHAAQAEFNVENSFVSCEESGLGSTINVWGRSGVKATIYDSEIYTYSRGWHQSEDANDNSITFQGATSIDVDIQRSNMHLYGARSIIYARQYGSEATTIKTNMEDSLIWVVTKSSHGENTLPVWGFDESNINDSILLFTKNVHQSTPAVFKSFVYGNPTIHGDYHVTTQCQWDAPIELADGQTVTFASDADVSIYDGAGKVEFVKTGSAEVVLETGAQLKNIGY